MASASALSVPVWALRRRTYRAVKSLHAGKKRIFAWQKKAVWTLADQGLFSGANFVISILLARWLTSSAYGAYSLAYSVFLICITLHSAILVEPMVVFGSGKYANRLSRYARALFGGHLLFTIPVSILLLLLAISFGHLYSVAVRNAMLALACGAVVILLLWLVRSMFYILLWPSRSALASGVYFVVLIATVIGLKKANLLSALTAFLAMAVASLMASVISVLATMNVWRFKGTKIRAMEMAANHWKYGRWALCTAIIQWFPGNIYFALLPKWMGLEETGALRALMNIAMPVLQAITALSMLLLPSLVRQRRAGPAGMNRTMMGYLLLFFCGAGVYACAICLLKERVFQLVYSGKYSAYAGLPLVLAALLPFGSTFTAVLANGLRALESPNRLFWCYLASSLSALTIGLPLASVKGVTGALIGMHVSAVLTITMMLVLYRKALRHESCFYEPEEQMERLLG